MSEESPILEPGVWIKPGPATLVLRSAGWAIFAPGTRKPVLESAWRVLQDPPTDGSVLEAIASGGGLESVEELRDLVVCLLDGDVAAMVVKGDTPVAIYDAQGARHTAGTTEEPIVSASSESVRRLAFGSLPPEESLGGLRITEGIVRAGGVVHMVCDAAALSEEDRSALAEQIEADGRMIDSDEAKADKAEREEALKKRTEEAARRESEAAASRRSASPSPPRASTTPRRAAPTAAAEPTGPSVFDDLFGGGGGGHAGAVASPAAQPVVQAAPAAEPVVDAAPAQQPVVDAAPAQQPVMDASPAEQPVVDAVLAEDRTTDPMQERPSPPDPAPEAVPASEAPAEPAADVPAPTPVSSTAAVSAPVATEQQAPRRRRLLSTSLFDRQSKASPSPDTTSAAQGGEDPTTSEPVGEASAPAQVPPQIPSPNPAPDPVPPADGTPDPATPASSAPEAAVTVDPAPASAPTVGGAPVTQVSPIDEGEDDALPTPQPRPRRRAQTQDPGQAASTPPADPEEMPESTGTYDVLFGPTVFRSIEDAAVRRTDEDEEHEDDSSAEQPEQGTGTAEEPEPVVEESAPSALPPVEATMAGSASAQIGDFIDWVPGVGREAPEIAQAAARRAAQPPGPQSAYPQVQLAERPSPPVTSPPVAASRPEIPAAGRPAQHQPALQHSPRQPVPPRSSAAQAPTHRADAPEPAAAPRPGHGQAATASSAPIVLPGLLCRHGHGNPPERSDCRFCGESLVGPSRPVPRPSLGYIEITTGEAFRLDRSAIIGRKPRVSRVSGHEVPQLITVPSPQQDISRNHLELRLEGWHVVALDLGATNGTTLLREGQEPERLIPGRGVVLRDLDVLDLGDGIKMRMREDG